MDIEAEKAILKSKDLSWMDKVGAMNIEMHLDGNENIDEFLTIIESKGFTVWKDTKHWSVFLRYEVNCNLSVCLLQNKKLKNQSLVLNQHTW
jgi:hypothetical protein